MDYLTFISKALENLAWPTVVIVAIVLLKKHFPELMRLIKSIKYKNLEINFREMLDNVRDTVDEAGGTAVPAGDDSKNSEEKAFLELARLAPAAAVMDSWKLLEKVVDQIGDQRGVRSHMKVIDVLRKESGDEFLDSYRELRELRNAAVHASDRKITTGEALEYRDLVRSLAVYLKLKFA